MCSFTKKLQLLEDDLCVEGRPPEAEAFFVPRFPTGFRPWTPLGSPGLQSSRPSPQQFCEIDALGLVSISFQLGYFTSPRGRFYVQMQFSSFRGVQRNSQIIG